MSLSALEAASSWANIAIVVLGIGAAIAAAFALYFGARLSSAKDAELARFQTESRASIAAADARAAEANQRASEADEKAAEANTSAAEANLKAAELNARAASAELELAKLRQRLAPRTLGAEQEAVIVSEMVKFKGERLVVFSVGPGNDESFRYARQLGAAFRRAGLNVQDGDGAAFSRAHTGLSIAAGANRKALGAAVKEALLKAKLAQSATEIPLEGDNRVELLTLFVWAKGT